MIREVGTYDAVCISIPGAVATNYIVFPASTKLKGEVSGSGRYIEHRELYLYSFNLHPSKARNETHRRSCKAAKHGFALHYCLLPVERSSFMFVSPLVSSFFVLGGVGSITTHGLGRWTRDLLPHI